MKLLIDHNLPHWWAATLKEFCSRHYQIEVHAVQDVLPKDAKDVDIFKFAKENGYAILTQDKYRVRVEQDVMRDLGIFAFNLVGWERFPMNEQLGKLFRALPKMVDATKTLTGGGVFFVSYKNASVSIPPSDYKKRKK